MPHTAGRRHAGASQTFTPSSRELIRFCLGEGEERGRRGGERGGKGGRGENHRESIEWRSERRGSGEGRREVNGSSGFVFLCPPPISHQNWISGSPEFFAGSPELLRPLLPCVEGPVLRPSPTIPSSCPGNLNTKTFLSTATVTHHFRVLQLAAGPTSLTCLKTGLLFLRLVSTRTDFTSAAMSVLVCLICTSRDKAKPSF